MKNKFNFQVECDFTIPREWDRLISGAPSENFGPTGHRLFFQNTLKINNLKILYA